MFTGFINVKMLGFLLVVLISLSSFIDTSYTHNIVILPDSLLVKYSNIQNGQEPFWDKNIGTIITGFISALAIILGYINTKKTIKVSKESTEKQLNVQQENLKKQLESQREALEKQLQSQKESLDRQLKVQLATTIEKEWILSLRGYLATLIYQAQVIAIYHNIKRNEGDAKVYNDGVTQFFSTASSIKLLLDINKPLENELVNTIEELTKSVLTKKKEDIDPLTNVLTLNKRLIELAHRLFNSRAV